MHLSTIRLLCRFYYSLLVSVRLYKKQALLLTPQGRRLHVARWLDSARNRQLFDKVVKEDIEWLLEQNRIIHPDELEQQLQYIYLNARFICLTAGIRLNENEQ